MTKSITIISILFILITSCSKSDGGGTKPSTRPLNFVKFTHKGRTVYLTDSARPSVPGIPDPEVVMVGRIGQASTNPTFIFTAITPEIVFNFIGYKQYTPILGEYKSDGVFDYRYLYSGKWYDGIIHTSLSDGVSKINLTSVDDSTITGTASLTISDTSSLGFDSSVINFEFRLNNNYY